MSMHGFAAAALRGVLASAPVQLAVGPFGLIFGVIATESGLNLFETLVMTITVLAGASQIAALHLLREGAPAIIAVITGICVNLRLAMYSASLAPYFRGASLWRRALAAFVLNDQGYAIAIARYTARPNEPLAQRMGYFMGASLTTIFVWVTTTAVGAAAGATLPAAWSLDFAPAIAFLALVAPMLRGAPVIAAALSAAATALLLHWVPYNFGLIISAAIGMGVGAWVESRLDATRKATR